MTATFVLKGMVNILLFRMPGDNRKFKRTFVIAFIPTLNRDFETASHTLCSAGISTMVVGVETGVKVWVAVAEGISVTAGSAGVTVNVSVKGDGAIVVAAGTVWLGRTVVEAGGGEVRVGISVPGPGICGTGLQSR